MEFQFPSFPILLSFTFFVFMLLKTGQRFKSTSKLPPGPWKLPLIGNLHQSIGSPLHRALRDLAAKHGPLMHLRLGEVPTLIVSSAEYAEEVMKKHDLVFASRPPLHGLKVMTYDHTTITFAPYGEYLRQLRKICTSELLSTKRVQSFRSIREEEMSKFIDWVSSRTGSLIDFSEKLFSSSYTLVSRVAFSDQSRDHEEFISIIKEVTKLAAGLNIADVFPSLKFLHLMSGTETKISKLHERSDRIFGKIIEQHMKGKTTSEIRNRDEDLVDVLLKFHDRADIEFSLTMNNIKAVLLDIFAAGSDTSATTIDWAMVEMMKNQEVLIKVQSEVRRVFDRRGSVDEAGIAELKYLKLVIKETLRLHPPIPLLLPRETTQKCEINGYKIPAKTRVFVNAWAIGRDPKFWANAERFYPERFLDNHIDFKGANFEYIPFGAGRRMCPGMTFGLANVELPLSQLLYYFNWELPNGMSPKDLDVTEDFGLAARRRDHLYLIPSPFIHHSSNLM